MTVIKPSATVTATQDFVQQSSTPSAPPAGQTKIYPKTDGSLYLQNPDGIETPVGSGSTVARVSQAHSFIVGNCLAKTGANYVKANASNGVSAEVRVMVSRVIDSNSFEFVTNGVVKGLVATCFSEGTLPAQDEVCFLSTTDGKLTVTAPSVAGQIEKPLFFVTANNTTTVDGIFVNMRGTTVGGANLYTTIGLANSTTTPIQNVGTAAFSNGTAGFIEGFIRIDATIDYVITFKAEWGKPVDGGTGYKCTVSYGCDDLPSAGGITLNIDITTGGVIQVQLPNITGFSSASATFCMQASAIGAQLPLQIDSSRITWQEPTMFRNRIINGNFDIWQRGTSQTTSGYGSDDRWNNAHNGSSKTASRQLFTLGQTDVPNNPTYYSRTVVNMSPGSGNYVVKYQPIEDVSLLSGRTVTVSFWAKADASKNIAVEFLQSFGTGGSPSSSVTGIGVTTVALSTIWTKYTLTVTMPSISGKTLGTNDDDFTSLNFWFDAGSSLNARTNSLGQQSGTFDIAQVQLELGTIATPFEFRPLGVELSLCYRYFEKSYNLSDFPNPGNQNNIGISMAFLADTAVLTRLMTNASFKVRKRIIPSVTIYSEDGTSNKVSLYNDSPTKIDVSSVNGRGEGGFGYIELSSNATDRRMYYFHWTASAELT